MVRRIAPLVLFVLFAGTCTGGSGPAPTPSVGPNGSAASPAGAVPIILDVVASTNPATVPTQDDRGYLDGMRLAVRVVNELGGVGGRPLELSLHDDGGLATRAADLLRVLADDPRATAILFAGPGPTLTRVRSVLEATATPVVLLGGDLYTSRGLFPEVFQTTIPWEWQAKVIAKYLVTDREAGTVAFIGSGPEARSARTSTEAALAYWGGRLAWSSVYPTRTTPVGVLSRATNADAVVGFGAPSDVHRLVDGLVATDHPPLVSAAESLLAPTEVPSAFEATACYTYTWAGWARPIPRVGGFIRAFTAFAGHPPAGFEQEGFDAVRILARGLAATHERGGRDLIEALEAMGEVTYSSFPILFGPDDHLFLPRDELGLFAFVSPEERLDPWQPKDAFAWRPIMRTFTYDGQRDNVLDRDRRVFFPFWRKNQPGPYYWSSRYGITSRPSDPLH
jgi:branched-chain amino acid transport system substrate-binding protein